MTSFTPPPATPPAMPPTERLSVSPAAPSYRDLPEAPPAYHADEAAPRVSKRRRGRDLRPQEELALGVGVTVLVLVVAKVVCDLNDVGTNVVDYLLGAALLAVVGVVVVGVGGALVGPVRSRWTGLLDTRASASGAGAAPVAEAYPAEPTDPRLL